jgi:hypothetical protein
MASFRTNGLRPSVKCVGAAPRGRPPDGQARGGDPKRDISRLGRAPTGETEPMGTRTRPAPTAFKLKTSSIINHTVPLSRGRVARIVPEFCAPTTPENGATPCARRSKEFLARGAFYLLNCCTNVDSQAADGQCKCRPGGGGEWATVRAFLPKGRREEAVQRAGMVGPFHAQ